jgi:hypothetical protein
MTDNLQMDVISSLMKFSEDIRGRGELELLDEELFTEPLREIFVGLRSVNYFPSAYIDSLSESDTELRRFIIGIRESGIYNTSFADLVRALREKCGKSLPPPVIPLDTEQPLPPFPLDCLPEICKQFAVSMAESIEVDPAMAGLAVISALSGIFGGRYKVHVKAGYSEPLNIYSVIVDDPSGRKSVVIKYAGVPFGEIENSLQKEKSIEISKAVARYQQAKNDYDKLLKKGNGTIEEVEALRISLDEAERGIPSKPRIIVDSITVEKLVEVMADNNGRLIRTSGEAGVFSDVKGGRYNKCTDIDTYLSAYSGERFSRDTKSGGTVVVESPALTLSVAAQTERIKEFMNDDECFGRGLCARFFYGFGVSTAGNRSATAPALQGERDWERFINYAFEIIGDSDDVHEIKLSPEAFVIYEKIYDEIHNHKLLNEWESMKCWGGKAHGHLLRIVGNIHCAECVLSAVEPSSASVSAETFLKGEKIWRCLCYHAERAYSMRDESCENYNNAHFILKKVKGLMKISKRDLRRKCKSMGEEKFVQALEVLCEHNYFIIEAVQTGGRPSEIIKIMQ